MQYTVDSIQGEQAIGRDSTGSITVTLGPGFRVEELSVSNAWRKKLGASHFVTALHEAIGQAVAQALERGSAVPAVESDGPAIEFLQDLPSTDADNASQRLSELCSSVLDEVSERIEAIGTAWNTGRTGADDQRRVEATVDISGMPTSVAINEAWLATANVERLTNAIRQAIDRAQDAAAVAQAELRATPHPASDRLRALADPAEFRAWLREEL